MDAPRVLVTNTHFGPDTRIAFLERQHQHPQVDVSTFEADLVRPREMLGCDDVEHPECFLFGQEEQKKSSEEIQRLTVADLWAIDGKGLSSLRSEDNRGVSDPWLARWSGLK